ncbi:leucine Rich Repeat [Geosmithia morbida]|uniref:Leucine Rich Repeat n=1 Tax=Geosmithia morbida TaxID=1094350 RepID=A0A9P5D2P4_9HYPO|nr:leucine Rich Repeat [Geosmithia morbida]KAF4121681.1 leucine Rich Repeat [Geosmithia morbida]
MPSSPSILPSYRQATSRPHCLSVAAPYISPRRYPTLCLVSRTFWSIFAPRLWADIVRSATLARGYLDDIDWWFRFVEDTLPDVRLSTRRLVRVLDLRLLAPAHNSLIYLDISGLPGSISPLLASTDASGAAVDAVVLPDLRILGLRRKELDDATLVTLLRRYAPALWSLDVSDNPGLSDRVIQPLADLCFAHTSLRSHAHFQVEGSVVAAASTEGQPDVGGSSEHGPFYALRESELSGSFTHPDRYYVDAPLYEQPCEGTDSRPDGSLAARPDSADACVAALLEGGDMAADDLRSSLGLTHIHLSNTGISSVGLQKLIRLSNGHIEDLSCDSMRLLPPESTYRAWPPSVNLRGVLGAAHLFRPVLSSSLRVLRIHHSLVTNLPTLEMDGLSPLERIHVAETVVGPRVDAAFPQTFEPDMNPRLASLTLTCIPRRSAGTLADRLIAFLKLLSQQERSIQDAQHLAAAASSWRAPTFLRGLRHVRLEFDPDPIEDGLEGLDSLNAEELMNEATRFSFFDQWYGGGAPAEWSTDTRSFAPGQGHDVDDGDEYLTHECEWNGHWSSLRVWIGRPPAPRPCPPSSSTSRDTGAISILGNYRSLVLKKGVRTGAAPVTPAQRLAGVPADAAYIFHTAWTLAVLPPTRGDLLASPPPPLHRMRDVLGEVKKFRVQGREVYSELGRRGTVSPAPLGEPHYFWTGRLEVSL